MKIGNNIRKIRILKNLKQECIANMLGITQSGYAKIERNEVSINMNRLAQIAKILDSSVDEFLNIKPYLPTKNFENEIVLNNTSLHDSIDNKNILYENQIIALETIISDKSRIISLLEKEISVLKMLI